MAQPTRFPFAFDLLYRPAAHLLGIRNATAYVEVSDDRLLARFGRWSVQTERSNVVEATVSGPYWIPKTIGPAHLSFRDGGLTFATTSTAGVCMRFRNPVRGIEPLGILRHPNLTVTVADPHALVALLTSGDRDRHDGPEDDRTEQELTDELHAMTASELRAFARDHDIDQVDHVSSASKSDLLDAIEHDAHIDLASELPE